MYRMAPLKRTRNTNSVRNNPDRNNVVLSDSTTPSNQEDINNGPRRRRTCNVGNSNPANKRQTTRTGRETPLNKAAEVVTNPPVIQPEVASDNSYHSVGSRPIKDRVGSQPTKDPVGSQPTKDRVTRSGCRFGNPSNDLSPTTKTKFQQQLYDEFGPSAFSSAFNHIVMSHCFPLMKESTTIDRDTMIFKATQVLNGYNLCSGNYAENFPFSPEFGDNATGRINGGSRIRVDENGAFCVTLSQELCQFLKGRHQH